MIQPGLTVLRPAHGSSRTLPAGPREATALPTVVSLTTALSDAAREPREETHPDDIRRKIHDARASVRREALGVLLDPGDHQHQRRPEPRKAPPADERTEIEHPVEEKRHEPNEHG